MALELLEQSSTKTFKYMENIKEKQTKPRKLNPSEFHNLLIKGNCPLGTLAPSREARVAKMVLFGNSVCPICLSILCERGGTHGRPNQGSSRCYKEILCR